MSAVARLTSVAELSEYPWERRPGERAFEAFAHYRDLGADRSLRRVGRDLGKTRATIEELSVKWDWVGRALEYDAHLDRERRVANERALREMIDRQAQIGHAMQLLAAKKIERLSRALDANPSTLSPDADGEESERAEGPECVAADDRCQCRRGSGAGASRLPASWAKAMTDSETKSSLGSDVLEERTSSR